MEGVVVVGRSPEQIFEAVRRGGRDRFFRYEIDSLQSYVNKLNEEATPFLDYVPVKIVTIIENCVRGIVRELVDTGPPYAERGIDLISKWPTKSLIQSLRYYAGKQLTLGELAAHGFNISSLTDVISILSAIIDENNVVNILSAQTTRWEEDKDVEMPAVISDISITLACVGRIFDKRHIIVHEMARDGRATRAEADEFLAHARQLVDAIDWLATERLHGHVGRTQSMMNQIAWAKTGKAIDELDQLRGGGSDTFVKASNPVQEMEYHWDCFSQLAARKHAGYFDEGYTGSISPLIRAGALERLLRWRIDTYSDTCLWDPVGKS